MMRMIKLLFRNNCRSSVEQDISRFGYFARVAAAKLGPGTGLIRRKDKNEQLGRPGEILRIKMAKIGEILERMKMVVGPDQAFMRVFGGPPFIWQ